MTRTELDELSQRIASEMPCINNHIELKQDGYVIYTEEELGNFSYSLLVEIQKKLEVVAWKHTFEKQNGDKETDVAMSFAVAKAFCDFGDPVPLTTLPIIEE